MKKLLACVTFLLTTTTFISHAVTQDKQTVPEEKIVIHQQSADEWAKCNHKDFKDRQGHLLECR